MAPFLVCPLGKPEQQRAVTFVVVSLFFAVIFH